MELEWSAEIVDDLVSEIAGYVPHRQRVLLQEVFRDFSMWWLWYEVIFFFLEVFWGEGEEIRWFLGGWGVLWAWERRW